jgi:hypothetical protein
MAARALRSAMGRPTVDFRTRTDAFVGSEGMKRWLSRRKRDVTPSRTSDWDTASAQVAARKEARLRAVGPHRHFADDVSAILFRHDPIGINFEVNTDEYDAEAESIVLRLVSAPAIDSASTVRAIIHQEFVSWFDQQMAGPPERYEAIAREIWELLAAYPGTDGDETP